MSPHFPVQIISTGQYLPDRIVTNDVLEQRCGLPSGWIEKKTGVLERRWCNGETNTFMAAQAAHEAMAKGAVRACDLDLIINASGTQEQAIPDGGHLLQAELELGRSGIPCFSIHATCLSFLVALDIAAHYIAAGRYQRVLIVSADIASVGINYGEPESAALFGDAAAAVLLGRTPPGQPSAVEPAHFESYGQGASCTVIRGGGTKHHPNSPTTRPEDNLFHMEGGRIYRLVHKYAPAFLEKVRPGLSQGLGPIKLVISHQTSMFGLKSMRKYGIPFEKLIITLDRFGNCVSASLPLTLHVALQNGNLRRGDEMLLVGTGAGLLLGGMIIRY